MVRRLRINKYKKLSDIDITFSPNVNAISGINGTCKTTLLHIISNAYQAVDAKDERLSNGSVLRLINRLNAQVNTKIERLAKGDKAYNDPAPGYRDGNLFQVEYDDESTLAFRKHNSRIANRYSVKPYYKRGSGDKLPSCPVVYLSLSRLLPWGEYQDDDSVKKPSVKVPPSFDRDLTVLYKEITGISAKSFVPQKMGHVKNRQEFETDSEGVDSNTISSGEDNVAIMLMALLSLRAYYEALTEEVQTKEVCSVLLIDEFDATLHPSMQYKMLSILQDFSTKYHIQVIFTTHSIALLNEMLKKKLNVVYLKKDCDIIKKMEEPDPVKIEMYLKNKVRRSLVSDNVIPVFSEDEEAREFFNIALDFLQGQAAGFADVRRDTHLVEANFGAEVLVSLFKDKIIRQSSMSAICLLDGDHCSDLSNNVIALPGGASPEWVAFEYVCKLSEDGAHPFWDDSQLEYEGFTWEWFMCHLKPEIDKLAESEKSERVKAKKLYNDHSAFFRYVMKMWLSDSANWASMHKFADELGKLYRKTANYHNIFISKDILFDFSQNELDGSLQI